MALPTGPAATAAPVGDSSRIPPRRVSGAAAACEPTAGAAAAASAAPGCAPPAEDILATMALPTGPAAAAAPVGDSSRIPPCVWPCEGVPPVPSAAPARGRSSSPKFTIAGVSGSISVQNARAAASRCERAGRSSLWGAPHRVGGSRAGSSMDESPLMVEATER